MRVFLFVGCLGIGVGIGFRLLGDGSKDAWPQVLD